MGKKSDKKGDKKSAKAAKKSKAAAKADKKVTKTVQKSKKAARNDKIEEEQDLIQTLEEFRRKWEEEHRTTQEVVDGPPSRRANATLTACPVSDHLWLFGGEYFDGDKCYFYNDLYRYAPDKNEWKRFTSPTCPGPRSAHQIVPSPAQGGKLWLFGGEFASQNQTSFHHWRDLWSFDISTHAWEQYETKVRPSARSGHRMAAWKHLIILFGGFHDVGIRTSYLQDLWIWDTLEYKWTQVQFKETDRKPTARSGFSFLPCAEGIILHGGYCKEYTGKKVRGIALDDTWILKMEMDYTKILWEKRRRGGYTPPKRSGSTMCLWPNKSMGILFGGVWDTDEDEESLSSVFFNDLHGYLMSGNGRWVSLNLKKSKKSGGGRRKPKDKVQNTEQGMGEEAEEVGEMEYDHSETKEEVIQELDADDPQHTIPRSRYNTLLAVQKNILYLYGGILETESREYTLDDFFTISLEKLDRYICLKECNIDEIEWKESDSEDDSDDDEEDVDQSSSSDEEDEEEQGGDPEIANLAHLTEVVEVTVEQSPSLREQAAVFMGVSKDATRTAEDILSTPLPGETVAKFYDRSKEYWAQKAHQTSDNRGKELRRDGFQLAQERYNEYKPILEEIERIREEAEVDNESIGGLIGTSGLGQASRNRR